MDLSAGGRCRVKGEPKLVEKLLVAALSLLLLIVDLVLRGRVGVVGVPGASLIFPRKRFSCHQRQLIIERLASAVCTYHSPSRQSAMPIYARLWK